MTINQTLNTAKDLTNKGMERMTSLGELNLSLLDRLAKQQMATLSILMEHGTRTLTMATGARGCNELLKVQVEATQELGERVMTECKAGLAMAGQVRDEYQSWYKVNMAEVSADLRKAIPAL